MARPPGRPSLGLTEVALLLRMPRELLEAVDAVAKSKRSEWIREAMRMRLRGGCHAASERRDAGEMNGPRSNTKK